MNGVMRLAFRGSSVAALAVLMLAPACSEEGDDGDDTNGGEAGSGGSAGSGGKGSGGKGSGGKAGSSSGGSAGKAGAGSGGSATGGTAGGGTSGGGSGGDAGDATGGTSPGGQSAGGAGGEAGEAAGGSSPGGQGGSDAGGAGGAGGTGEPGSAKFCNTLQFGDADTTMILEVGEGAEKVTFTALTGTCSPADGNACTPIPSGPAVRVQLFDADDPTTALDDQPAEIAPGGEYAFFSDVEAEQPIWDGLILDSTLTCQDFTYADTP